MAGAPRTPAQPSSQDSSKSPRRDPQQSVRTRHSYVRFFPSDWKSGTGRMPRLHRSVYHDICCEIWDFNAPLTPGALRLLLSDLPDWQQYVDDLVEGGKLIRLDDGSITNERASAEATWAYDQWEKRSFGGKGGRNAQPETGDEGREREDSSKTDRAVKARDNQNQNHIPSVDANASTAAAAAKPDAEGADPIDIAKSIFDGGVNMLKRQRFSETRARSIVGKWRKDAQSDGIVLSCLSRAQAEKPSDLVAWMTAAITAEKGRINEQPPAAGPADAHGPTERASMAAFGIDPGVEVPADGGTARSAPGRDPHQRALPDARDQ